MKYKIDTTNRYLKELELAKKRGFDINDLYVLLTKLMNDEVLEAKYKDHLLIGDYKGYRECHINPDWLLIYKKDKAIRIITLYRTGTHSDLFKK